MNLKLECRKPGQKDWGTINHWDHENAEANTGGPEAQKRFLAYAHRAMEKWQRSEQFPDGTEFRVMDYDEKRAVH
jgi:hypothetical protein